MTRPIRIGAHLWPGGAPDYTTWRAAVLRAEELGADVIFGYDHFHRPAVRRVLRLHDAHRTAGVEGLPAIALRADTSTIGRLVAYLPRWGPSSARSAGLSRSRAIFA
jgi:hypothetical protein